ncbi:hypothetical protein TSUD_241330 [Trifolium subterraneum]|uniref:Transmembrane protein n=1 Tax=Trifolium subterraneum TaxID=3900 RepID=A0A2Z6P452_TRISU|nr:hypothetical protein TSUD_241330 [Trifolium subterraneum]
MEMKEEGNNSQPLMLRASLFSFCSDLLLLFLFVVVFVLFCFDFLRPRLSRFGSGMVILGSWFQFWVEED